jgi:hypothetical protein
LDGGRELAQGEHPAGRGVTLGWFAPLSTLGVYPLSLDEFFIADEQRDIESRRQRCVVGVQIDTDICGVLGALPSDRIEQGTGHVMASQGLCEPLGMILVIVLFDDMRGVLGRAAQLCKQRAAHERHQFAWDGQRAHLRFLLGREAPKTACRDEGAAMIRGAIVAYAPEPWSSVPRRPAVASARAPTMFMFWLT